jgi:xylulose-5-phosphate/fructose-6-phosphate phosphoketolase
METIAAAQLLRRHCPEFEFRVVNVVDLMALFPEARHPHGMGEGEFVDAFTADTDVVFAFHGYPSAVHHQIHGRPNPHRYHVLGYQEEGTTTTPFDMVVRNEISRYHLCIEAMHRSRQVPVGAETLVEHCNGMLRKHEGYVVEHLEDMPEVRDWRWSP